MPYIGTSSPDPRVMSTNAPWLFRYSAGTEPRPGRPGQLFELTSSRSCQPSPSASNHTAPDPIVSGRYFRPNAPLLWTKRMPVCAVTSVNVGGGPTAEATIAIAPKPSIRNVRTAHGTTIREFWGVADLQIGALGKSQTWIVR